MNKEELKLCEIINSYAIRRIGNLSPQEEALNKYKTFCIELIQENKELHNKIDKAIEYIEDYGHGYDCTGDGYYCLDEENQKELLEILKGENND